MAMVNMNNLLNGKDSRWLQLEVCREFQRNKCTRSDTECKFAHPPVNVEVQSGRVIACYDSIKDRCNRETPPCKYFHPPQHLKDQLLINGRNHLALKNALKQQMGLTPPGQPILPGQVLAVQPTNPYLAGVPQVGSPFSPYFTPGPVMPAILGPDPVSVSSPLNVVPQSVVTQQKITRSDRLEAISMATVGGVEVGKKRVRDNSDEVVVMDMKSVAPFYYESFAFPGMVPYKRPAAEKSGMPVYQPNATTYQQLMQLQPPPFVPVPSIAIVPPPNAHHVVYTDEHGQLLDTLPVCQDFMRQFCNRPACKFIHLQEAHVEVVNMRVTVCRDAVKGKCTRPLCKYYHIPIPLPPASEMVAQLEDQGQTSTNLSPATVAIDAVGQLRTNMMVSSGIPNRTLCHQIFGFNS